VSDAKRLRALEEENARLKRLLADTMLDNAGLKDLLSKNGDARREAGSGRASPDGAGNERAAASAVVGTDRQSMRCGSCRGDDGDPVVAFARAGAAAPAAFAAEKQRLGLNPPVASPTLLRDNNGPSLVAAG
jgi:hypothetical protein